MQKWRCTICEYVYDPAVGDPDNGVAAGTSFEDLPDDWVCPSVASRRTSSSRSRTERGRVATSGR